MKGLKCLALAPAVVCALAPLVGAQPQPAEFLQVISVTVRPGAVTDYEDYVKKVVAAANKVGSPLRWTAHSVALGGPGYTYSVAIPFSKWADMDGWASLPEMLTKAFGEVEAARVLKAGRSAIERSETAVYRHLPNFSTRPKVFDPPAAFIQVVRTEIEPEMTSAYELFLAKLKTAQEQAAGSPTSIRRVSATGRLSVYVSASPFQKHADRDAWPPIQDVMIKAYGEAEGRQILETSLRCVRSRELLVLSYRPDLSRTAGGAPPAK
jgi:hypothetical protein